MNTTGSDHIAIRLATGADTASIARLAALDSAPVPHGPMLVADLGGEIVAAHSLGRRGRSIADPFRPTADARELLELRAHQIPPALPTASDSPRRHLPGLTTHRRRAVRSATASPAAR